MLAQPLKRFFLVLICAPSIAFAGMYRWVDDHGVTVYSQQPPATGDAVKLEKQPGPSESEATSAQQRLLLKRVEDFDREEERKRAEMEQLRQQAEKRRRSNACATARRNLQRQTNLRQREVFTVTGKFQVLPEHEIESKIETAERKVDLFCE